MEGGFVKDGLFGYKDGSFMVGLGKGLGWEGRFGNVFDNFFCELVKGFVFDGVDDDFFEVVELVFGVVGFGMVFDSVNEEFV